MDGSRPRPRYRIAALFVGRFKSYEKTYEKILANVFAEHDVDVFFSHNAANPDNLDDFASRFNIKSAQSMHVNIPEYIYTYDDNGRIYANNGFMWLMFFHLHNGMSLIETYAAQQGVRYDIVLYLRADMHFESPVQFELPVEGTIYIPDLPDWCGINDQMAYGTLAAMKLYASTFLHLETYYKEDRVIFHPEKMTLHNLLVHGIHIMRFPLNAHLDEKRHYDTMSFCDLAATAGQTPQP